MDNYTENTGKSQLSTVSPPVNFTSGNGAKTVKTIISEGKIQDALSSCIIDPEEPEISQDEAIEEVRKIGFTFGELLNLDIPPREEIIRGLGRRENGLMLAVTNGGKTTTLRNLAISLILGKPFPPFSVSNKKLRVAIIDSEDTLTFLRSDIQKMCGHLTDDEKKLVSENLFLLCEVFPDQDLQLDRIEHRDLITTALEEFKPDLVIADTISKCFSIRNENDNSEIKERVMKPLHQIAKQVNAALFAAHHIGKAKSEEGAIKENAHRGRGASAFADLSRVIYNLEKDEIKDRFIISCAKIKGQSFEDMTYSLDPATRLLTSLGEKAKQKNLKELILDKFSFSGAKFKTGELVYSFKGIYSESSVKQKLKKLIEDGDLYHPDDKQGVYAKANDFGQ